MAVKLFNTTPQREKVPTKITETEHQRAYPIFCVNDRIS